MLYLWSRARLLDFYAGSPESPADCVVLGEVVCARRRELRLDDWLALARELTRTGKRVILATQALGGNRGRSAPDRAPRPISPAMPWRPGDASALASHRGRVPLVLGPHVNASGQAALREHADLGVLRWVPPLGCRSRRSPISARRDSPCADPTAAPASHGVGLWPIASVVLGALLHCAPCQRAPRIGAATCMDDPDGRLVRSTEASRSWCSTAPRFNRPAYNLLEHDAALASSRATRVRLSPQSSGFTKVIEDFDAVLNGGQRPRNDFSPAGPAPASLGHS